MNNNSPTNKKKTESNPFYDSQSDSGIGEIKKEAGEFVKSIRDKLSLMLELKKRGKLPLPKRKPARKKKVELPPDPDLLSNLTSLLNSSDRLEKEIRYSECNVPFDNNKLSFVNNDKRSRYSYNPNYQANGDMSFITTDFGHKSEISAKSELKIESFKSIISHKNNKQEDTSSTNMIVKKDFTKKGSVYQEDSWIMAQKEKEIQALKNENQKMKMDKLLIIKKYEGMIKKLVKINDSQDEMKKSISPRIDLKEEKSTKNLAPLQFKPKQYPPIIRKEVKSRFENNRVFRPMEPTKRYHSSMVDKRSRRSLSIDTDRRSYKLDLSQDKYFKTLGHNALKITVGDKVIFDKNSEYG